MTKRALNRASAYWRIGFLAQVLVIGLIFGISRVNPVLAEGTTIHTSNGGQIAISNEHSGSDQTETHDGSDEGNFTTDNNNNQDHDLVISDEFSGTTGQGEGNFTTPPSDNGGNGGGNGGGGGGGGRRRNVGGDAEEPAPVTPCEPYIKKFVMIGRANDAWEVKKLQMFLILHEGEKLLPTGVYDQTTIGAVKRFQLKYAKDILTPWGLTEPTGHTFFTTSWTINNLVCERDTANNFDLRNFYASRQTAVAPAVGTSVIELATSTVATTTATATPAKSNLGLEADAGFAWLPGFGSCAWLVIILILVILWLLTRIYNLKQEIKELKQGGAPDNLPIAPDPKDQPPLDLK